VDGSLSGRLGTDAIPRSEWLLDCAVRLGFRSILSSKGIVRGTGADSRPKTPRFHKSKPGHPRAAGAFKPRPPVRAGAPGRESVRMGRRRVPKVKSPALTHRGPGTRKTDPHYSEWATRQNEKPHTQMRRVGHPLGHDLSRATARATRPSPSKPQERLCHPPAHCAQRNGAGQAL